MTTKRKPVVALVAIRGTRLKHPIEAKVCRVRRAQCPYCETLIEGGAWYRWGHRGIGQVKLSYGCCCLDCGEPEA